MKLLLDENLSPRLVRRLADAYPHSTHVRDNGYCIVPKDNDFRQRSLLRGAPPKVVWLAVGNAGTGEIAELLLRERSRLLDFASDDEASLLALPLFGAIGPRCHELRIRDTGHNWRVLYRLDTDAVLILDVFDKKTQKTPKSVLDTCRTRADKYDRDTKGAGR